MAGAPTLRIDFDSPIPAYRQIVDSLRIHLVNGALTPGAQLPSVRRLAMELGVHFNTVGEAYRELAAEGWLDLRHGRGATVIARGTPPRPSPERILEFRDRLRSLVAQMRAEGVSPRDLQQELRSAAEGLTS